MRADVGAFFDELEKIGYPRIKVLQEGAEAAMRAAGGMSGRAQGLHRAAWLKQEAAKKALAPRLQAADSNMR